ncbi:acyl carrier protein, partial [Priestia megaterium]|uniref:acyl carrier protein n=1 Tax=Priestia megaterium TaxID=1404 RepID=UPI0036DC11DE
SGTGNEQAAATTPTRAASPTRRTVRTAALTSSVADDVLAQHVKDVIYEQLKLSLKVDRTQIAGDDAFMDHGIDSIIGVQLIQEINQKIGIDLATTDLFDHGSVNRLTRHIVATHRAEATASLPGELRAPAEEPAPTAAPPHTVAPQPRTAPARAPQAV